MPMSFRPLPALSLVSAILLVALVALGAWQLERLRWKLALIDAVQKNMAAAPITLDEALTLGAGAAYHRVQLEGRYDNARESYVFGTGEAGDPVFHVIVPFRTTSGREVLIDRGIVPQVLRDPAARWRGLVAGRTTVVGVWRAPEPANPFAPNPDHSRHIWYSRDVFGMAKDRGIRLAASAVVEADATPNPGGWPKGGQTVVSFRNEHLQYAITWFLLAAGLVGVYFAYHVSRGRLTFSKQI